MIYLDNAATTICKSEGTKRAVIEAMEQAGNASRGAHQPALTAAKILYETRKQMAALIHASSLECISFASNATEALNTAIKGVLEPGDLVVTSVCEHNSVLRPLYEMQKKGVQLEILPADQDGIWDYDRLEEICAHKKVKALVFSQESNVTGNLLDIQRVKKAANQSGALLIVDGAQSVGSILVDVEQMGIDVLVFTGHKALKGPQGTGGLYVRKGLMVKPLKVGGSGIKSYEKNHPLQMPEALEAGTQNIHGLSGLNQAVKELLEKGVTSVWEKEHRLTDFFDKEVRKLKGIHVYGNPLSEQRGPIVSLNIDGWDSAMLADTLWEEAQIAVRSGAHCAPLMHEALGTKETGVVRFSFSEDNTMDEVKTVLWVLQKLTGEC